MPDKRQEEEITKDIIKQVENPVEVEDENSGGFQKEPDLLKINQKLPKEAFVDKGIAATGQDTCGDLKMNTTMLEISEELSKGIIYIEKDAAGTAISEDLPSGECIDTDNDEGVEKGANQEISDMSSVERIETDNEKDVETGANQGLSDDLSTMEQIETVNEKDVRTGPNQDISNDLSSLERIDTRNDKDLETGAKQYISDDLSSIERIDTGNVKDVETETNQEISHDLSSIERLDPRNEKDVETETKQEEISDDPSSMERIDTVNVKDVETEKNQKNSEDLSSVEMLDLRNEKDVETETKQKGISDDLSSIERIYTKNEKDVETGANKDISEQLSSTERTDTENEKDVETGTIQDISDDLKKALSLSFFEINEKSSTRKTLSDSKMTGLPRNEPPPDYNHPSYRGGQYPPSQQQQQYQHHQQYPYQSNQQYPYNQTPQYQQRLDGQVIYVVGPAPPPQNLQRDQQQRVVQVNRNQYGMSSEERIFVRNAFDDIRIRHRFVQRVYAILAIQLSFSFLFICLVTFAKPVKIFVRTYWGLALLAMFMYLVLVIVLVCCSGVRRQVPTNFIMLGLLTFFLTYMIAFMTTMYAPFVVMAAVGMTALICTLVSLFAMTTRFDITSCGMCLCICMICLMLFGLIAMIISFFIRIPIIFLVYSCLACLLFIMFLMYDTQQIIGGKRFEMSPEEYIYGALTLYIDIMYIFMYILAICGYCRR